MEELPKGTLVRIMDWNSDDYMQVARVDETLSDGRIVLYKGAVRLGAFRSGSIMLLEGPGEEN